jgi:Glyoxalase/Bleomycin resistance protein/Dioxygenase superfamily
MENEKQHQPIVNVTKNSIVKIGIVVQDAVKTAMKYAEIFGVGPWVFTDKSEDGNDLPVDVAHDHPSVTRCAVAEFAGLQVELFQPISGTSTYSKFLESRGEGVHHAGLGNMDAYEDAKDALNAQSMALASSESGIGDPDLFYTKTQQTLGTIFELKNTSSADRETRFASWGKYAPQGPGVIPIQGKEINQLGIVVADAKKTAEAYWEIFGIGPWVFVDAHGDGGGVLHGVPYSDHEVHIKVATAELGKIQFELLQPVYGVSSHMEFLRTCGHGIHHVSFGDIAADHDPMVEHMAQLGVGIEMSGVLGASIAFTYFETQKDLGTIYEVLKVDPSIECTLIPTGIYPPQ